MSRLRVALFSDSDVYAGTESHLYTLAQGLRECGVSAGIACPSPSPLAEKAACAKIEVFGIQKRGLIDRRAIRSLVELLKSGRVQIVHAHNGRTHLNAFLAVALAGKGRCVATQHFIEPDHAARRGPKAWLYRQAHRWVNRRAAHFIAISEAVRQGMLARQEAPEHRITVVPNGIHPPDPARLTPPERLRSDLGIPLDAPLIVCAARLEREKDIASLIAAMPEALKVFPAARCLIAGQGAQHQALAAQIRTAGLEQAVRLLGFRSDALALMQAADVFVLPSLAEPFGLAILEAMALARPVIATCAGGPLEIVEDGVTGLLIPPANPAALAQAILQLLRKPETSRRMGQRGRARFETRYMASHMANATREIYCRAAEAF
jgi:glycosyltransferase involved in cell wall biosynthesis